jgi:hypothetical protein
MTKKKPAPPPWWSIHFPDEPNGPPPKNREELLNATEALRTDKKGRWRWGEPKTMEEALSLFRMLYPDEENAVDALFEFVLLETMAHLVQREGPWHPADVLRLHPFAFASRKFILEALNLRERLAYASGLRFAINPRERRVTASDFRAVETDDTAGLRAALEKIGGAWQEKVPDVFSVAARGWKAAELREEVQRVTDGDTGSKKRALSVVAKSQGFTSSAAMKKQIERDLNAFRQLESWEVSSMSSELGDLHRALATTPAVAQKTKKTKR